MEFKRGTYAQDFQKWYGRFNRKYITKNKKKVFHSMRHSFINALIQKAVPENIIADIVGHKIGTMTGGRYGKEYNPIGALEAMLKLDYGFDVVKIVNEAKKKKK